CADLLHRSTRSPRIIRLTADLPQRGKSGARPPTAPSTNRAPPLDRRVSRKAAKTTLFAAGCPERYGNSVPAKSGTHERVPRSLLKQRPELTFKQNHQHGRHGWLRLTPAYSVRLVEQILEEHGQHAQTVFDPFSGTGTTALCAAYRGKAGLATDI